ncbi:hypothetical protein [Streptomyces sp. NPDC097981]|uniref:hypothetical protein n=1 Tax=Streptomyces sp. NPDC097981 TaxID=3155428 RepID=UPI003329E8D6
MTNCQKAVTPQPAAEPVRSRSTALTSTNWPQLVAAAIKDVCGTPQLHPSRGRPGHVRLGTTALVTVLEVLGEQAGHVDGVR